MFGLTYAGNRDDAMAKNGISSTIVVETDLDPNEEIKTYVLEYTVAVQVIGKTSKEVFYPAVIKDLQNEAEVGEPTKSNSPKLTKI